MVNLPCGVTARVHRANGTDDYRGDLATIFVAPGDVELLGWGASVVFYLDVRVVRNGRHRLDREVWQAAVKAAQRGGVVYVQHEQRDYYGKPRWTAVEIRKEPS